MFSSIILYNSWYFHSFAELEDDVPQIRRDISANSGMGVSHTDSSIPSQSSQSTGSEPAIHQTKIMQFFPKLPADDRLPPPRPPPPGDGSNLKPKEHSVSNQL